MRALRVGQHALLIECADADQVAASYALLRAMRVELGAVEVVPAATTVLLDGVRDQDSTIAVLDRTALPVPDPAAGAELDPRLVELPTTYDGADLGEVARQWETTTDEVIRLHQDTLFVVSFCGFAPGFAYCSGLPGGLSVSRRPDPRPAVPAGSVALADEYTGVYPGSSPGGWQLIGRTTATLWRSDADVPALLSPGTQVRFVDA